MYTDEFLSMSAVYCSQGWRRKERVWGYISMTGFTASLMVLKLVPSMEGFATGSTAKAVGSGEVALAVTDHWTLGRRRSCGREGIPCRSHTPCGPRDAETPPGPAESATHPNHVSTNHRHQQHIMPSPPRHHIPLPNNNHAAFNKTSRLYFISYNNQSIDSLCQEYLAT